MRQLHLRILPPELYERLRERATTEGRSMSSEAIALLRHALGAEESRSATPGRAAIERLRDIRRRSQLSSDAPPAEQLVREDRDSAR